MCSAKRRSESERKNEIMQATIKIITEKGFDKTTMDEIVARTTLSKGGVYHYYGSVTEIFKDIMICGIEYREKTFKSISLLVEKVLKVGLLRSRWSIKF